MQVLILNKKCPSITFHYHIIYKYYYTGDKIR